MQVKYYKLFIDLSCWHLKPYKKEYTIQESKYIEYGFLCFKYVIG